MSEVTNMNNTETNEAALTAPVDTAVAMSSSAEPILGFEEAKSEDNILPRIKVINALSPERVDGIATEGDVINALTTESVKGKRFIPIKVYYSNIEWNPDRDDEENRMFCRSLDGITGTTSEGECKTCKLCGRNQFDNSKTGKEAQPRCTSYMNFLGFFEDDPMPVVLSFSRTNYNEGKKMLSVARSLRKSIWSYSYLLDSKQVTKGKNKWFIITSTLATPTTEEERCIAAELFKMYQEAVINADYADETSESRNSVIVNPETEEEI